MASSSSDHRKEIELRIEQAVKRAKNKCSEHGVSFPCMRAWEEVDNLVQKYYEWSVHYPLESADVSHFLDTIDSDTNTGV